MAFGLSVSGVCVCVRVSSLSLSLSLRGYVKRDVCVRV